MSIDLVPDHVWRAVRYLALLNANGVEPTDDDLDAFALAPQPLENVDLLRVDSLTFRFQRRKPVATYLRRIGWTTHGAKGVRLTQLGGAMAASFGSKSAKASQPDSTVLDLADAVLEPGDPDAFERFARIVAELGTATLCDPYFKASSITWVLRSTQINRVLLTKSGARQERIPIAARLAGSDVDGKLEVRVTEANDVHDRALVATSGDVWLLGTSLNGVGRHLSSLVRPDPECWPIYRQRIEGWWKAASPIEPQPITDPVQ